MVRSYATFLILNNTDPLIKISKKPLFGWENERKGCINCSWTERNVLTAL